MIEVAKVVELKPIGGKSPWLRFSHGHEGVRDCSDILAEGGAMAETLRDPALFQRAVLSFGAPTGPNGFDLDPLNVHMEMKERGPLRRSAAA